MLRDGIEPAALDIADTLDVAYTYLVDGMNGMVNAQEVRDKVDEAMAKAFVDRDTWGNDVSDLETVTPAARSRAGPQ